MNARFEDYMDFPMGAAPFGSVADEEGVAYVYIIGFEEAGVVKIGSAKCVSTRLCELQCGNPFELKVKAAVAIYGGDVVKIEMAAHRYAKQAGFHLRGEWFELSDDDALRCVLKAARDKKARYGPYIELHRRKYEQATREEREAELAAADEERRRILRVKLGMDA